MPAEEMKKQIGRLTCRERQHRTPRPRRNRSSRPCRPPLGIGDVRLASQSLDVLVLCSCCSLHISMGGWPRFAGPVRSASHGDGMMDGIRELLSPFGSMCCRRLGPYAVACDRCMPLMCQRAGAYISKFGTRTRVTTCVETMRTLGLCGDNTYDMSMTLMYASSLFVYTGMHCVILPSLTTEIRLKSTLLVACFSLSPIPKASNINGNMGCRVCVYGYSVYSLRKVKSSNAPGG
jgi:hypothetical protein